MFFLVMFLYFYFRYRSKRRMPDFAAAIVAANLACYYKEPVFLLLAVFGLVELVTGKREKGLRGMHLCLLLSAFGFLAAYYLLVLRHSSGGNYAEARRFLGWWLNLAQNIRGFAVVSDPALILFFPALAAARLRLLLSSNAKMEPPYDSLLAAALTYVLALLVINTNFTVYYLLPATVFALPSLGRVIQASSDRLAHPGALSVAICVALLATPMWMFFVIPLLVCAAAAWRPRLLESPPATAYVQSLCLIFALNILPNGLNTLVQTKLEPIYYQQLVGAVAGTIAAAPEKVNMTLYRRDRSIFLEGYLSLISYLRSRSLPDDRYDLRSELRARESFRPDETSPWEVFRASDPQPVGPGGYVISFSRADAEELQENRCEVIFRQAPYWLELPGLDRALQCLKGLGKRSAGLDRGARPLELFAHEEVALSRCSAGLPAS